MAILSAYVSHMFQHIYWQYKENVGLSNNFSPLYTKTDIKAQKSDIAKSHGYMKIMPKMIGLEKHF